MLFAEIVKKTMLPHLKSRGFEITHESNGFVVFSNFFFRINLGYNYAKSKETSLFICYHGDDGHNNEDNPNQEEEENCLDDYEIIMKLEYHDEHHKKREKPATESEEISHFAEYYDRLFREKGDIIFSPDFWKDQG
jgi:hypothetical protein